MLFSELELKRMVDKGFENISVEDEIKFNILNFIHCIHLNKQDFYSSCFDSHMFGDVEMIFKKEANSLIGHCRVNIKKENKVIDYLFTENDFELLQDVVRGKSIGF